MPAVLLRRSLWLVVWCSVLGFGVGGLLLITLQAPRGATDFCQDYASAVWLLHGKNVYQPVYCNSTFHLLPGSVEYNSHPPTSILLYLPFGLLPQLAATLLWGLVSLMAYVGSMWLLLRAVHWPVLPGLALFAFGSLFWLPGAQAAQWLNMEQVLLLLLVGVWLLSARRQETAAGVLLGIASLLRIWPLLFLFVPLLQRRWRLVTVTGVVVGVGVLLALVVEGPGAFVAYAGPVRVAEEAWASLNYPANVSLTGAVVGILEGYMLVPPSPPLVASGIPPATAAMLGEWLGAVLLVASLLFLWWNRRSLVDKTGGSLAFGLVMTLILLAFPLTWSVGLILLLLPAATLVRALGRLRSPPGWWWGSLGASLLLLNASYLPGMLDGLPYFLQHLLPGLPILLTIVEALPTLGLLLLGGAQAYLLVQVQRRAGEAPLSAGIVPVELPPLLAQAQPHQQ